MRHLDPVSAAAAAEFEIYGRDWIAGDPADLRRRMTQRERGWVAMGRRLSPSSPSKSTA